MAEVGLAVVTGNLEPPRGTRVVVGLSGGVDSSVAAARLVDLGCEVQAVYMRNWHNDGALVAKGCPYEQDVDFASLAARRIGIPFQVVDLSNEYCERVVEYLFREYAAGRTPNPDVLCNREIKFDSFLKVAQSLGAAYVATGHYCQHALVDAYGGTRHALMAGADPGKDQSYFLCQIGEQEVAKALFPVGAMQKSEVRATALKLRLATAQRKDSYGICFIGEVEMRDFLGQRIVPTPGPIIELPTSTPWPYNESAPLALQALPYPFSPDQGGEVGQHQGAAFYTIGQRKGLNVGGKAEGLYVIGTDIARNVVYVGMGQGHPLLYRRVVALEGERWLWPEEYLPDGASLPCLARLRYRQPLQACQLIREAGILYARFDTPQRGATPGQFCAWYLGERLVGSGVVV